MKVLAIAAVSVTMLATAACSSTEDANVAYCDAAVNYINQVVALEGLDSSSTVDQWSDQIQAVRDAAADLREAGQDLTESQVQDLQDAIDDWDAAVDAVPGETPVDQAKQAVSTQTQAVKDAYNAVGTAVCPESSASPSA